VFEGSEQNIIPRAQPGAAWSSRAQTDNSHWVLWPDRNSLPAATVGRVSIQGVVDRSRGDRK
jgi:hypothetical protein